MDFPKIRFTLLHINRHTSVTILLIILSVLKGAKVEGTTLKVQLQDNKVVSFEDCWLRDHCRCPQCYHSSTNQRAYHILDIPDVTMESVRCDDSTVTIKWSDSHESTYNSDFISQFDLHSWNNRPTHSPILWHGDEIAKNIARLPVDKFINNEEGAKQVFQSLLDYGIALIEQVEPTMEATEEVCQALGGVQYTMFGGMWKVSTNPDHADTAYSNLTLKQHTDNTYFTEPAGWKYCEVHNAHFGLSMDLRMLEVMCRSVVKMVHQVNLVLIHQYLK